MWEKERIGWPAKPNKQQTNKQPRNESSFEDIKQACIATTADIF